MRRSSLYVCLTIAMLVLSACATEPEPAPAPGPAPEAAPAGDAVSGTWTGNWGPSPQDRNQVTLQLRWDGTNLTGTVNPDTDNIQLTSASYDPASGMIMMMAQAQGRGGATIQYTISGTVQGNMMTGTWGHDDRQGDFTLTRS